MTNKARLAVIQHPFADRAELGTGVSNAILRRVARGDLGPTMRLHRTGRILAFGRMDRLSRGYGRAVELARDAGFEPIERMAGGRAAVFHESTLAFSIATPEQRLAAGTRERFERVAATIASALRRVGVKAEVGEVPGEYCPGAWSVNDGHTKLAGIGQRTVAGGAHVGGVIVIRDEASIREVLVPVYEALGLEWDPATAGSVAASLGAGPTSDPAADTLLAAVVDALRAELSAAWELIDAELDDATLELAEQLRERHRPRT